ncbi:hypothetical protein DDF62_22370 [Caulobacter radicis]|uniref:hypothetical protein n=1 Tax=Caulobacter radicis TaxID=2172650 RepID=UPI000D57E9F9|nr:hypothetical protein [Caulobacter radicis]PVM84478.1 hypothetical protein DDF62_22370 [Caulobacter radicis]
MSGQGAFGGDAARKHALIADVADKGPVYTAWLTPAVLDGKPGDLAAGQGLHPAIGYLLPPLGTYDQEADSGVFYQAALEAVPVGADEPGIVRAWFLWAWDHPTYGLSIPLRGTSLEAAAETIIDLVRESRSKPIEPKRWRQARAALSAKMDETGLDPEIADPILSMAWDIETTPAIGADVFSAWMGPVFQAAHTSQTWTEADAQAHGAKLGELSQKAMAEIGEVRQGDPEQYAQYKAIMETLWSGDPATATLYRRQQAHQAAANAIIAAWRAEVRRGFIACAEAAAQAVAA